MAAFYDEGHERATIANRQGSGAYVVLCDNASNHIPAALGTLGLPPSELTRHIAWDPGAAEVARRMSTLLDAPLVESRVSRLVCDCNRPLDAPDLVPPLSETTVIPGNSDLSEGERARRVAYAHQPFHEGIDALVGERLAAGREVRLVSVHSFTPVYKGNARPWPVGILHDEDERLSAPLIAALTALPGLAVGDNQPYSPADRVYYTLERHARRRGLACAMIEIRNDEIANVEGQDLWARRLADMLGRIVPAGQAPRKQATA